MDAELLLGRLDGVIRTGEGRWSARCTAHDDRSPSLSVPVDDDQLLFHCHAGCAPEDVLAVVGLSWSDLYADRWEAAYRIACAEGAHRAHREKLRRELVNGIDMAVERMILRIGAADLRAGRSLTIQDRGRVEVARLRVEAANAVYLAGISGDTISRDRVSSSDGGPEERVIRRPCLNVCVMVQPDKYLEVAAHPALRASGALARIWPAWLPSMVGQQHERLGEPGMHDDRLAPYSALVLDVIGHLPGQDRHGRPIPHQARLSSEATEALVDIHNELQDRMRDGGDLADMRDVAAKAVTQICKLALVLHVAADPDLLRQPDSQIEAATWAAAHCIGLWFLDEAVRMQRAAVEDPLLETARTLAWLGRRDEATATTRTLSLYGPRPRPGCEDSLCSFGTARRSRLAQHGNDAWAAQAAIPDPPTLGDLQNMHRACG